MIMVSVGSKYRQIIQINIFLNLIFDFRRALYVLFDKSYDKCLVLAQVVLGISNPINFYGSNITLIIFLREIVLKELHNISRT